MLRNKIASPRGMPPSEYSVNARPPWPPPIEIGAHGNWSRKEGRDGMSLRVIGMHAEAATALLLSPLLTC